MLDQEHTACHYVLLTRQMVIIRGELEQDPFWEWDRESVA